MTTIFEDPHENDDETVNKEKPKDDDEPDDEPPVINTYIYLYYLCR